MKKLLTACILAILATGMLSAQPSEEKEIYSAPTLGYSISGQDLFSSLGYGAVCEYGVTPKIGKGIENDSTTAQLEKKEAAERATATDAPTPAATAKKYGIYIGPYAGVSISSNTSVVEGRKLHNVGFNVPSIGGSIMVPFSETGKVGGMLDIGVSGLSYTSKPSDDDVVTDQNTITEHYNYFNIQPSLYLGGFVLGLNFGIPTSAEAEDADGESFTVYNMDGLDPEDIPEDGKVDETAFLKTLMEVKVGGRIPMVDNDFGRLSFDVMVGYAFSGLYEDEEGYRYAYDEGDAKSELNPKPVSITLGLCYQFRVGIK